MDHTVQFRGRYAEQDFWRKLGTAARTAGLQVVEKALWLYFAAQRPATPAWARATVYAALAYFIWPADALPDVLPAGGYADDLGVLAAALATVAAHVDDGVRRQADALLARWFGPRP